MALGMEPVMVVASVAVPTVGTPVQVTLKLGVSAPAVAGPSGPDGSARSNPHPNTEPTRMVNVPKMRNLNPNRPPLIEASPVENHATAAKPAPGKLVGDRASLHHQI